MKKSEDMTKRKAGKIAQISVVLVIMAIIVLWFHSGSITVDCNDTYIKVTASYWADLDINYSEIDTAVLRKDLNIGERTVGVESLKLSVGTFINDEFGSYTLYAYTDATEFIVLTSKEHTVVIGLNNVQDIKSIFSTILKKIALNNG